MAALHSALRALSPVDFTSVPLDGLEAYMRDIFSNCDALVNSVPIPPSEDPPPTRARSQTVSSAISSASVVSSSSVRSAPPMPEHAALQKEWGKPIKLSAKENPLGVTVYKLPGKDGRGAWFARRSVHEGMDFAKWKLALEREFPQSMEAQGGPGDGNVRGIGGERRVEEETIPGVGRLQVYHLSAQFPGPTAPRDFVALLLTSSNALMSDSSRSDASQAPYVSTANHSRAPRHFVVISKPCIHPDCPPRDGFVRGEYESIECIREIPVEPAYSGGVAALDLPDPRRRTSKSLTFPHEWDPSRGIDHQSNGSISNPSSGVADQLAPTSRRRGKTISFAEPPGASAARSSLDAGANNSMSADSPPNPVEWIMITRSDPGGSVPRWMVERGTPAGIVTDASKFLDWAIKIDEKQHSEYVNEVNDTALHVQEHSVPRNIQALDLNNHLPVVGLGEVNSVDVDKAGERRRQADTEGKLTAVVAHGDHTVAVVSSNPSTNPEIRITDQQGLGYDQPAGTIKQGDRSVGETGSISDSSSALSFTTASSMEYDEDDSGDSATVATNDAGSSHITDASKKKARGQSEPLPVTDEKQFHKLNDRKRKLQEKLAATRSKLLGPSSSPSELPPKRSAALAKAEERHQKEVEKHELKYRNHVQKLESKMEREKRRKEEKQKKQEEKDERAQLVREKEELKRQVEASKKETAELIIRLGELQAQNTLLAAKLGKADPLALHDVLAENKTPPKVYSESVAESITSKSESARGGGSRG